MIYPTFEELYARLQELFGEGEYSTALDLATRARDQFPDHWTILDYWRFTLSGRTGDMEGALEALRGALEKGSWYSELLLRRSPSLQPLQGDPRFEALVAQNQHIAEHDQEGQYPFYIIRPEGKCRAGGPPCPLLIGLHTNGGSVGSSIDFWKPAATLGWLVAAPQSSQALMKGIFVWDDRQTAEREIQKDYEALIEHYAVNPWQTVLAGQSLGGETAIWLTLKGALGVNYFLAVGPAGPWIDDLNEWEALLREPRQAEKRGYIIAGELDETISIERITELVELLNRAGIETELEIVPGSEHDYDPNYEGAVLRGLNFLVG